MEKEKQEFIKQYVIAYVSLKMYGINRDEVQHQWLPKKHTLTALEEAEQIWNTYQSQQIVP